MHEMSLMRDLMRKVCEFSAQENAKKVVAVNVWLGALSHISAEHFQEHFDEEARGTVAEGAKLAIEVSEDIHDKRAQDILILGFEIEDT